MRHEDTTASARSFPTVQSITDYSVVSIKEEGRGTSQQETAAYLYDEYTRPSRLAAYLYENPHTTAAYLYELLNE